MHPYNDTFICVKFCKLHITSGFVTTLPSSSTCLTYVASLCQLPQHILLQAFVSVLHLRQKPSHRNYSVPHFRPRKPPSTVLPRVLRDEDPCLVSTVTESILPLLPDKTPVSSGSSTPLGIRQGPQVSSE